MSAGLTTSIRIGDELKEEIEIFMAEHGYVSMSECIRFLISKGLETCHVSDSDLNVLTNSIQNNLLTKEIIKSINFNQDEENKKLFVSTRNKAQTIAKKILYEE